MPSAPSVLLMTPYVDEASLYECFLRIRGFTPIVCGSVDEGLHWAAEHRPDVIVTRLGYEDARRGIDDIRQFRTQASTCDTPIVAITTSILPADREAAEAAGCNAYVMLPAPPDALVHTIGLLLAERGDPSRTIAR